MEFVGQPRPSGARNLLAVPGLGPLEADDDECEEVVVGIRPKSSPLPRRRSCDSDEDSEPGPPPSGSRRVSFADARGLSLVHVKEFDTWNVTKLPEYDSSGGRGSEAEAYFLSPLTFSLPLSAEELLARVREQKIELETIELLPGTTVLKGAIRVLNVSFDKAVYIRTTLDGWSSHFDLLAEYVPGSGDGATDRFSFRLALAPPFGKQGARVDFCLRYETPAGTFWANNNDRNYALFCLRREKRKETPQNERVNNKSCLKTVCRSFSTGGNIGEMDASSTDAADDGAKVDSLKAEKSSDGQSATSEEDRQKLLAENRQLCSQRSGRKAARMARVKDYFCQRNVAVDDTERDENQKAAREETPEPKRSEGGAESEGSRFVSESPETCDKTSVPEAEQDGRKRSRSAAARPAGWIESPDSQTGGFSFGTVVAPLYPQVVGRVGDQSARGSPVRPARHAGGPGHPRPERGQAGCTVGTEAKGHEGKIQEQVTQSPCSNPGCLVPNCPPLGKEEMSPSATANGITDLKETPRDPGGVLHSDQKRTNASEAPEAISGDAAAKTDPPNPRLRATSASTAPPPPESVPERVGDEAQRQAGGGELLHQSDGEDDACQTEACSEGGEASEAPRGFNPNHVRGSDTEATEIRRVSCSEKLEKVEKVEEEEEEDVTKAEMSLGTNWAEREMIGGAEATVHNHTIVCEDAQNIEHHEMDSKREELLAAVNWETMVEEEEKNVLTDEEESLKAAGNDRGQSEDGGREKAFEKKDTTETVEEDVSIFWEIKAARQKKNEAEDADVSEGEQTNGEESGEIMAEKGRELEYTEAPNEAGEEDLTEEKREKQEIVIERKNVQNKEDVEEREVMETHQSGDDQAGVWWEDRVKPAEVHLEEENPHHQGENSVVETEESEITDAGSRVGMAIGSEGGSDVTRDKAADAAPAVANNVQDDAQRTSTDLCKGDDYRFCEKKASASLLLESDQSAESDSGDEVELHMHCLRAKAAAAAATRAGAPPAARGLGEGRSRPPAGLRGKLPPMPSISEGQDDEEQHRVRPAAAAAPPAPRGGGRRRRWETFSCSEVSKTLLSATALVVFLAVAYRYDFLACLGLYLGSVVWLYCQEGRQPKQQKKQQSRLD